MAVALRRVLVTGSTGYLGSHLVPALRQKGCEVCVAVRPTSTLGEQDTAEHIDGIYLLDGTAQNILGIVQQSQPDVVVHLATKFVGQHSTSDLDALITSNVQFGTQLLSAAAICRRPVVNIGTSWQHLNADAYSPINLYAATKQSLLAISQYFVEAEDLQLLTIELPDIYGPDDYRGKLIDQLCTAHLSNKELALGSGTQVMDPVFVTDAVEAVLAACHLVSGSRSGAIFSITSGSLLQVRDLIAAFQEIVGTDLKLRWNARPDRKREMRGPWVFHQQLPGWKALIPIREGLRRTLQSHQGRPLNK